MKVSLNWQAVEQLAPPSLGEHLFEVMESMIEGTKARITLRVDEEGAESGRRLVHGFTLIATEEQPLAYMAMALSLKNFGLVDAGVDDPELDVKRMASIVGRRYRASVIRSKTEEGRLFPNIDPSTVVEVS